MPAARVVGVAVRTPCGCETGAAWEARLDGRRGRREGEWWPDDAFEGTRTERLALEAVCDALMDAREDVAGLRGGGAAVAAAGTEAEGVAAAAEGWLRTGGDAHALAGEHAAAGLQALRWGVQAASPGGVVVVVAAAPTGCAAVVLREGPGPAELVSPRQDDDAGAEVRECGPGGADAAVRVLIELLLAQQRGRSFAPGGPPPPEGPALLRARHPRSGSPVTLLLRRPARPAGPPGQEVVAERIARLPLWFGNDPAATPVAPPWWCLQQVAAGNDRLFRYRNGLARRPDARLGLLYVGECVRAEAAPLSPRAEAVRRRAVALAAECGAELPPAGGDWPTLRATVEQACWLAELEPEAGHAAHAGLGAGELLRLYAAGSVGLGWAVRAACALDRLRAEVRQMPGGFARRRGGSWEPTDRIGAEAALEAGVDCHCVAVHHAEVRGPGLPAVLAALLAAGPHAQVTCRVAADRHRLAGDDETLRRARAALPPAAEWVWLPDPGGGPTGPPYHTLGFSAVMQPDLERVLGEACADEAECAAAAQLVAALAREAALPAAAGHRWLLLCGSWAETATDSIAVAELALAPDQPLCLPVQLWARGVGGPLRQLARGLCCGAPPGLGATRPAVWRRQPTDARATAATADPPEVRGGATVKVLRGQVATAALVGLVRTAWGFVPEAGVEISGLRVLRGAGAVRPSLLHGGQARVWDADTQALVATARWATPAPPHHACAATAGVAEGAPPDDEPEDIPGHAYYDMVAALPGGPAVRWLRLGRMGGVEGRMRWDGRDVAGALTELFRLSGVFDPELPGGRVVGVEAVRVAGEAELLRGRSQLAALRGTRGSVCLANGGICARGVRREAALPGWTAYARVRPPPPGAEPPPPCAAATAALLSHPALSDAVQPAALAALRLAEADPVGRAAALRLLRAATFRPAPAARWWELPAELLRRWVAVARGRFAGADGQLPLAVLPPVARAAVERALGEDSAWVRWAEAGGARLVVTVQAALDGDGPARTALRAASALAPDGAGWLLLCETVHPQAGRLALRYQWSDSAGWLAAVRAAAKEATLLHSTGSVAMLLGHAEGGVGGWAGLRQAAPPSPPAVSPAGLAVEWRRGLGWQQSPGTAVLKPLRAAFCLRGDGAGAVTSVAGELAKTGERVMALVRLPPHTLASSHPPTVLQHWPVPDGVPLADAAALPVHYLLAGHLLCNTAQLRPQAAVLVHAPPGAAPPALDAWLGCLAGLQARRLWLVGPPRRGARRATSAAQAVAEAGGRFDLVVCFAPECGGAECAGAARHPGGQLISLAGRGAPPRRGLWVHACDPERVLADPASREGAAGALQLLLARGCVRPLPVPVVPAAAAAESGPPQVLDMAALPERIPGRLAWPPGQRHLVLVADAAPTLFALALPLAGWLHARGVELVEVLAEPGFAQNPLAQALFERAQQAAAEGGQHLLLRCAPSQPAEAGAPVHGVWCLDAAPPRFAAWTDALPTAATAVLVLPAGEGCPVPLAGAPFARLRQRAGCALVLRAAGTPADTLAPLEAAVLHNRANRDMLGFDLDAPGVRK